MSSNPSASGKNFFTIEPRSCALIVIDMQNAFVAEGAVFETPPARAMIPRLELLIRFARASGIPIVWTQSDHRPPYGGLMLRKFPPIAEAHILWYGEPSYEMYPHMLQPQEGKLEYRMVNTSLTLLRNQSRCHPALSPGGDCDHHGDGDQRVLRIHGSLGFHARL